MPAVQLAFDFDVSDIEDTAREQFHASRNEPAPQKTAPDIQQIEPPIEEKTLEHNSRISLPRKTEYRSFGSWVSFTRRLSAGERIRINNDVFRLLEKSQLSDSDMDQLRHYSGWGGLQAGKERGVLYDFYTSPPVADLTWRLLNKVRPIKEGGRILEPSCGTGVFFETAPGGLELHGVELDQRTAAVASRLFPGVHIQPVSFEAFNISEAGKSAFDHVIGNVPFGGRSVNTSFLDLPDEKNLDRYFISRAIDNLKPEGTCALIVHPGVLSGQSSREWRMNLTRKAHFLGAVKLNDRSFAHAHTTIQPDILIFQKHPEDVLRRLAGISTDKLIPFTKPFWFDGTYFDHTPGHVIGEIREGKGQWGSGLVSGPITPESLEAALNAFTADYPRYYDSLREWYALPAETGEINASPETVKKYLSPAKDELIRLQKKELADGAVKTVDDSVYILDEFHQWNLAAEKNKPLSERLNVIASLARQVKAVRAMMRGGDDAENYQKTAKTVLEYYKNHFAAYPKDDGVIRRFVKNHPAVSDVFEGLIGPDAEILNTPNLYDSGGKLVDGHNQAVRALLFLREQMLPGTPANIFKYFPDDADALAKEMYEHPDIFLTPDQTWQLREDFISGNAWEKIDGITAHIEGISDPNAMFTWYYRKWVYGIAELEKAVGWVHLEDAQFTPHNSWIPEDMVNAWITDANGLDMPYYTRLGKNAEGKWGAVSEGGWEPHNDSVVYYLNMQKQRQRYVETEVYNKEHNESFRLYVTNRQDFRETLEKTYNRLFNTEIAVPVKIYPVFLEDWQTTSKSLKSHQWQSIHLLYRNQKGISALGTGFGKTLAAIGLHALLRQEGKITRSWFQVPNNKVKDWVKEIHSVFPGKTIGYIDTEMPGYSSRDTRYARYQTLANSKFDIIIMPESAAGEIQLSPENDALITESVIAQQLVDKAGLSARKEQIAEDSLTRKMQNGKTNRTISFEDFGCDAIFVDEAHRYKNLFSSSLSRETGMNDGRQSAKAMSLFKKTEYIRRQNQGKNVFLFTATPLTNSPLEYYNMLMYVAPEELYKFHINTIDGFIRNFADIQNADAYDWKTGAVTNKKVLVGFRNIQSLQSLFFKYTDYQNNPEKINLKKPDAHNKPNVIPINPKQTAVLKDLSEKLETYMKTPAEKRPKLFPGQNFLTFYSKMRTASLDLQLFDPEKYAAWENPKLTALAKNARKLYAETKAGQVVFCDRVFSSDGSFNIHDKIKNHLVKEGFLEQEIIIVNGFTKSGGLKSDSLIEKEVSAAVDAFNRGKYKILIGSTACIGEGLNLQENSSALHHFDIPFRPSDFIQRNGRVDRQGNSQNKVELHTYMSAGTIDNYSVSLVQNKANWIDLLLRTKSNVFLNPNDESFVDSEELLMALTEEWGDEQSVAERRKQLEETKQEKMREAENNKRIELVRMLSLTRGLVHNYQGDINTPAYKNRIEKIKNIEKLLAANKTLADTSILESSKPFLYDPGSDMVFRQGDVIFLNDKPYQIESFNYKNQSLDTKSVIKLTEKRYHNGGFRETCEYRRKDISLKDIGSDSDVHLIKNPSPAELDAFPTLHTENFYRLPDPVKERLYYAHLVFNGDGDDRCSKLAFSVSPEEVLHLDFKGYLHFRGIAYYSNPFSVQGLAAIREAAKNGVVYDTETDKKEIQTFINRCLPDLQFLLNPPKSPAAVDVSSITIDPSENTAENFRHNIAKLKKSGFFPNNPYHAARVLIKSMNEQHRQSVNGMLRSMGCNSPESTKKIINSWFAANVHELDKKSCTEINR
jgi:hypothetical protein